MHDFTINSENTEHLYNMLVTFIIITHKVNHSDLPSTTA